MPLSVLIADDHELFRSGLKQLLADELDAAPIREAETFDQAVETLSEEGAGDLILIDLRMPGMAGAETLAALRDAFPEAKVAVVSAWEERGDILAALAAGVHGYVPKSLSAGEIAAALRDVLEGRIYVPASIGKRVHGQESTPPPRAAPVEALTPRQKDVLDELLKGMSSKEIARALDIAEGTVKIHLAAIYRALGVSTRAQTIAKLKSG